MQMLFSKFSLVVVVGFLYVSSAIAQEIPEIMLKKEGVTCEQQCSLGGNDKFVCETLCGCTVQHFSKLSLPQFQEIKTQLESESVSAETQQYLAGVGTACVAELDRVMSRLSPPKVD